MLRTNEIPTTFNVGSRQRSSWRFVHNRGCAGWSFSRLACRRERIAEILGADVRGARLFAQTPITDIELPLASRTTLEKDATSLTGISGETANDFVAGLLLPSSFSRSVSRITALGNSSRSGRRNPNRSFTRSTCRDWTVRSSSRRSTRPTRRPPANVESKSRSSAGSRLIPEEADACSEQRGAEHGELLDAVDVCDMEIRIRCTLRSGVNDRE